MDEFFSPMDEKPNQNCNDKMNTHLHPNHITIASCMEGVQRVKGITLATWLWRCFIHIGKRKLHVERVHNETWVENGEISLIVINLKHNFGWMGLLFNINYTNMP
jgi:hypothetical protein